MIFAAFTIFVLLYCARGAFNFHLQQEYVGKILATGIPGINFKVTSVTQADIDKFRFQGEIVDTPEKDIFVLRSHGMTYVATQTSSVEQLRISLPPRHQVTQ